MGKNIRDLIKGWPKSFIKEVDLAMFLADKTAAARHALVKRALKGGFLIRIRRGLYLIADKAKPLFLDEFELASSIYGPSFISLESALSYHGWLPEAVYTITSASIKRAKEFKTPVGIFSYKRVPVENFYTGVNRIETSKSVFFIATPWRAFADFIYTTRRSWKEIFDLELDLRIDMRTIMGSDMKMLELLSRSYPSCRVRAELKKFMKQIMKSAKVNT